MPFLKLATSNHRCSQPTSRPDGTPLVYGDVWQCDEELNNGTVSVLCCKIYRWTNDQREGNYWEHLYQGGHF